MSLRQERHLVGPAYLDAVTALLQRVRGAHPTAGLFEAADLQWWWRAPRATDHLPQLFWFDSDDRPAAAVIATEWSDRIALDPLVLPDTEPEWLAQVMERGLAHAEALGLGQEAESPRPVGLEVRREDVRLRELLTSRGYATTDDGVVEAWLESGARPAVSSLADGYRSCTRVETAASPHHMSERGGPQIESRLRQTSLYRSELDLVVLDPHGTPAAYGLCWFDPVTATGLVEPMRTHDDHQRRGLARHVLTAGVDLLARAGAERIKICYEPGNPASGHLYRSVGFVPIAQTDLFTRPVGSSVRR